MSCSFQIRGRKGEGELNFTTPLCSRKICCMIRLFEVATARASLSDSSCLEITVDKKLGELSLKDIDDWSHIWIVFVDVSVEPIAQCILAELISCKSRTLTAKITQSWSSSFRIVDLKPYHFLEYFSDS